MMEKIEKAILIFLCGVVLCLFACSDVKNKAGEKIELPEDVISKIATDIKSEYEYKIQSDLLKIVEDVFGGQVQQNFYYSSVTGYTTAKEKMLDSLQRRMEKVFDEKFDESIKKHIESEVFIDAVIERINRKQLKRGDKL